MRWWQWLIVWWAMLTVMASGVIAWLSRRQRPLTWPNRAALVFAAVAFTGVVLVLLVIGAAIAVVLIWLLLAWLTGGRP